MVMIAIVICTTQQQLSIAVVFVSIVSLYPYNREIWYNNTVCYISSIGKYQMSCISSPCSPDCILRESTFCGRNSWYTALFKTLYGYPSHIYIDIFFTQLPLNANENKMRIWKEEEEDSRKRNINFFLPMLSFWLFPSSNFASWHVKGVKIDQAQEMTTWCFATNKELPWKYLGWLKGEHSYFFPANYGICPNQLQQNLRHNKKSYFLF